MLERWLLMIDLQLQGIKWIKEKAKYNGLTLLRMDYIKLINNKHCWGIISENLNEIIDAKLSPIIGRNVYKKKFYEFSHDQHEIHKYLIFIIYRNYQIHIILQKFKPKHV